jgi:hypothetical protein
VRSDEDSLSESHSEYVGSASDTDTSELNSGIKNQKSKKKLSGKHVVTTPPASKKSVNTPKAARAGKGDGGGESGGTPTTKKRKNMRKSVDDCKFMHKHNDLLKPLYGHYQVQTRGMQTNGKPMSRFAIDLYMVCIWFALLESGLYKVCMWFVYGLLCLNQVCIRFVCGLHMVCFA